MSDSKVVAKLEDVEGLVNHREILDTADAVVFSRGSLGTCMAVEKVCVFVLWCVCVLVCVCEFMLMCM